MANNFSVVMLKILAGALETLREECAILSLVPKDFEGAASKKGDTVSVSVPVAQTIGDVVPGVTPPAVTDTVPTEVLMTLDQWKQTRFHITEKQFAEMATGNKIMPGQVAEGVRVLANAVHVHCFSRYKQVYGFAGSSGVTPFATDLTALVALRQALNTQLCPEGDRHVILDYAAEAAYLNLPVNQNAYQAGTPDVLVNAALGKRFGMNLYRDGAVPLHTSTPLTAGAATINGAHAVGVTSVSIAKATNTSPLVQGDIITFAGDTQTYAVGADVTLAVGNTAVSISPALKVAQAGGAAVTLKATHRVNLAFDRNAWALATRPLAGPIEGAPTLGVSQSMTDSQTGLSLRLDYYPGYHLTQWELSLLWGDAIIDARRAGRLAG